MAREILISPEGIAKAQEQRDKKSKWSPADVPGMVERRREPYRTIGKDLFELIQERISTETA